MYVLHSFANDGVDGALPSGTLLIGSDNMFYGTTSIGGSTGNGTLFQTNPGTGQTNIVHSFENSSTDGGQPNGTLAMGNNNIIYGTSYVGGSGLGAGTIFSYNLNTATFATNYSFPYNSLGPIYHPIGINPQSGLVLGNDGKLYGVANQGGAISMTGGTLYQFDPTTSTAINLFSFGTDSSSWISPRSDLLVGSDGIIYGTTSAGGTYSGGTIFKY